MKTLNKVGEVILNSIEILISAPLIIFGIILFIPRCLAKVLEKVITSIGKILKQKEPKYLRPIKSFNFDEDAIFSRLGLTKPKQKTLFETLTRNGQRKYVSSFIDGIACFHYRNKGYHVYKNGTPLYKRRFKHVYNFHDGLALVRDFNDRMFHILKDGTNLYSNTFDDVTNFHDGIAIATSENKSFAIDKTGNTINEFKYDRVYSRLGSIIATIDNVSFHLNSKYEPMYDKRFKAIDFFRNGIANIVDTPEKCNKIKYEKYKKNILVGTLKHINMKGEFIEPISIIEYIGSANRKLKIFKLDEEIIFRTGCFSGNLEQFKEAVKETHEEDSKHYNDYMEIIKKYE